jgi:hypothetical protein
MSNRSKLRYKIIKNWEFYGHLRNFLVFYLSNVCNAITYNAIVCHVMTNNWYYFCNPKYYLRMSITMKPTKIKQSVYLLVPKNVADLIEIKHSSKLVLDIKKKGRGQVLEYSIK